MPLGASVAAAGALRRRRQPDATAADPRPVADAAGPLRARQLRRDGADEEARALGAQALRLTLYALLPVAAVAGAATPLMGWIFGAEFADGGALLALLIWGAPAFLVLSIATAILVAAGRPGVVAALSAPMVPAALVSYAIVVPRLGAAGVAAATSAIAVATAGAALVMACRVAGIALPFRTAIRTMLGAAVAFAAARGSLLVADGVLAFGCADGRRGGRGGCGARARRSAPGGARGASAIRTGVAASKRGSAGAGRRVARGRGVRPRRCRLIATPAGLACRRTGACGDHRSSCCRSLALSYRRPGHVLGREVIP